MMTIASKTTTVFKNATETKETNRMDVLERMKASYQACSSFSCEVCFERIFHKKPPRTVRHKAVIVFRRPEDLRVEWVNESDDTPALRCIVAGPNVISRYNSRDKHWNQEASLRDAIAAEAGVSGGIAAFVPFLLLGSDDFLTFENLKRGSDVSFANQLCFDISGSKKDRTSTLLISQEHYILLKLVERFRITNCEVEETSIYENVDWNGPVASAAFSTATKFTIGKATV